MTVRRKSFVRYPDGHEGAELSDAERGHLESGRMQTEGEIIHLVVDDKTGDTIVSGNLTREDADRYAKTLGQIRASEPSADPAPNLLDTPFDEIFADRDQLDRVIQVVVANTDSDYIEALDRFTDWARSATGGYGTPSLRETIESSPIELGVFDKGLRTLEATAKLHELEMRDAVADEEVDDQGRVLIRDPDERARRLTDPMEFERAYQRRLAGSGGSDEGREAYAAEYRMLLDAGIDPLATMERETRVRSLEARQAEADRVQAGKLQNERHQRRWEAEKRVADAQADLDKR